MAYGEEELSEKGKQDESRLDSIDKTLREILSWTRFANISKLKEMLQNELDTDQKKLAYESTDGINGMKEVAAASGAPQDTVYGWWQQWSRIGLVTESETRKGRMIKIVPLGDLGIRVPKREKMTGVKESNQEQSQSTEPSPKQEQSA
jgi:transposase-like protein